MGYINFELSDVTDIIVPENEVELIRTAISKIPKYKDFDLKKINSLNEKKKLQCPTHG